MLGSTTIRKVAMGLLILGSIGNLVTAERGAAPIIVDILSRINCFPEQEGSQTLPWTVTREQCEERGCLYNNNTEGIPGAPPCYMPPHAIGYRVVSHCSNCNGKLLHAVLVPLFEATIFDPPIAHVSFSAFILNDNHLQFKFEDMDKERFQVPFPTVFEPSKTSTVDSASFSVEFTQNPFTFKIVRKSTQTVLFDTSMGGLVFSDRFLQITTRLPSENLYGLGENEHPSLKHDLNYKTWAIFARDQPGLGEGRPLYGVHAMYMVLENDGNSHGVFLMNSNAMEYSLIPAPGLIIKTIGGIFDFHLYTGPTPESVVQQHTEYVGRPYLPPYWSLGFQLARWGYDNVTNMAEAIERTRNYSIPLDVIYIDIDHMDELKDFTLDTANFGDLPKYLADEKENNGLKSVIILDPAITNNATDYEPWDVLSGNDTFIKWENGSVMIGRVWPQGDAAFPDFFLERTEDVWTDLIVRHSKVIPFDGLWIDMNEPSNFGTNMEKPWNWPEGLEPRSLKCPESYYDDPPYRTHAIIQYDGEDVPNRPGRLSDKTLCMVAVQNDGKYKHYDVHSLYGWSQSAPTVRALEKAYPGKRGFVLSRSTFAGSGHYVSHWLGDNEATWTHMRRSIIGMLEMSLFGIPHTGPDICGFTYTPSAELCKLWLQLGAFYPYSRNHNVEKTPPQDPGVFGDEIGYATRDYMHLRYKMLPYLYTLFFHAHTDGSTVARPLFHEFPSDRQTWNIDDQFMLGSAFLVAPVLLANDSTVSAYLPAGIWIHHNASDSNSVSLINHCEPSTNRKVAISQTALFQRGGSVAVFQSLNNGNVISTQKTRLQPLNVIAVIGCNDQAGGTLFWDDGESKGSIEAGNYWLVSYSVEQDSVRGALSVTVNHKSRDLKIGDTLKYASIVLYNVKRKVKDSSLTLSCGHNNNEHCSGVTHTYDAISKKLVITIVNAPNQSLKISDSFKIDFAFCENDNLAPSADCPDNEPAEACPRRA